MWNIMEFTMKHGTWSWTKMEISRRSVGDIANDDLVSGFHRSFYFSMTSIFFRWVETTNQGSYTVYISNENGQNWRFWRIRTLDISTFFEHIFGWTREMTMRFSQRPPCFFRRPDHKDSNVPREGTRTIPWACVGHQDAGPCCGKNDLWNAENRQSSTWKIRQIAWSWFVSISMSFWSSSSPA